MCLIHRLLGLESIPCLLLLSAKAIHLVQGFSLSYEQVEVRQETERHDTHAKYVDKRKVIEWTQIKKNQPTQWHRKESFDQTINREAGCFPTATNESESVWLSQMWEELLSRDNAYTSIPLDAVFTIFRHRYQLRDNGLEIRTIAGQTVLFACDQNSTDRNKILKTLLDDSVMPNSIFSRPGLPIQSVPAMLTRNNVDRHYNTFMSQYLSHICRLWQKGEISNFEYLMHLNSISGRSFLDLTQYPVFPWILSDYSSEVLDLSNPASYRDLSKPMGLLGPKRSLQFQERFKTMTEFAAEAEEMGVHDESTPPPFFFGTHYSCSGYVLHYLVRLQPYTKMAVELQGDHFDVPDRLFLNIEHSWNSASRDNLQDVKELIPEFFYLPDFLLNSNGFQFGSSQKGDLVNHVILPKWASSPEEFIRIHREALESKYVSEHLHEWIDLIFGYKQRGSAAEDAMNLFIHLTYPGEVDIDAITDPVLRTSTISQIDNFGQAPMMLFNKPHPKKVVPEAVKAGQELDSAAVANREVLTAPLCVVGVSGSDKEHQHLHGVHPMIRSNFCQVIVIALYAQLLYSYLICIYRLYIPVV